MTKTLKAVDELEDELTEVEEAGCIRGEDMIPHCSRQEIAELRRFAERANSIHVNAKGEALLPALRIALDRTKELGGNRRRSSSPNRAEPNSTCSICSPPTGTRGNWS